MINLSQTYFHINSALKFGQNGKHTACRKELKIIYKYMEEDPLFMWDDNYISKLGKVIILMIHLDIIDDENRNIGLAHLAYLYISKGLEREQKILPAPDCSELFRVLKERVILLNNFDDFFVDSLISFYFSNQKATDQNQYNEQRNTVLSRMPLLQFADIHLIEQYYPNLKNDEFLLELSNHLEYKINVNEEDLKEAVLLHQILYKFIYNQLTEKKLCY